MLYSGTPKLSAIDGVLRFHLHPSVKANKLFSKNILLKISSGLAWIFKFHSSFPIIEDSVYVINSKPKKCQQIVIVFSLKDLEQNGSLNFNWELFKNIV